MRLMMFMLLMFVGCLTSLAALDLGPPKVDGVISQTIYCGAECTPIMTAVSKEVNILHKDSLMYSSTISAQDTGIDTIINADIQLATNTTSLAGVTGV